MKKYLISIVLIIIATICIGFFLYRTNLSYKTNKGSNTLQNTNNTSIQESNISDVISDISDQERNTEEILFLIPVSNNTLKVYTIGIDGRNLKELLALDRRSFNTTVYGSTFDSVAYRKEVITDKTTINNIKNDLDKFKDALLNYPIFTFSKNFYAYSMPIEESDFAKSTVENGVTGGVCFKGVFLRNVETGKTVRIDKDLINQIPNSLFSKDGNLFVSSLSFSHDGKFLFVTSYPNDDLSVFSMEQMKFTGTFRMNVHHIWEVDKVLNSFYFLAGTDSSNIVQFDMDKKEPKPLTDCQESSYAISPDNKNLVFTETETYIDGKSDLGILDLVSGTIKKIDYAKENEIAGFVHDSKHLIIKRYYKLSDTDINYHIAIYLLNLDTLKEAKIYAETGS